jgi:hypothetical protein
MASESHTPADTITLREEDAVDPRLSPTLRATGEDLDEGLGRQLANLVLLRTRSAEPKDVEKQGQSNFSTNSSDADSVIYVSVVVNFFNFLIFCFSFALLSKRTFLSPFTYIG